MSLRAPFMRLCAPRSLCFVPRQPAAVRPLPLRRIYVPRCYSTATQAETERTSTQEPAADTDPAGATAAAAETAAEAVDPRQAELEEKKREIISLKDRYLRSVADFRNLQDRTAREVAAARDFAITRFAKDLLDSVDNLDRALGTVPAAALRAAAAPESRAGADAGAAGSGSPDAAEAAAPADGAAAGPNAALVNLHDGLRMTEKVLLQTLARHGLVRFDPAEQGEPFDPNLHEASFMAPMAGKVDGTVFSTMQKGFKLNGRVIRAAKVGVVKNG